MANNSYMTSPPASEKMPAGVPYILGNEMGERFSFYGARCILVVFMTKFLLDRSGASAPMTDEDAKRWFHLFISAVYFMPLAGALLSDLWLGKYRTILWFSVLYCFGFAALALDQTRVGLFLGIALVAVGSGMIKPCVSANVGDQFGHANKHLMAKVYSWFYFSINVGAFTAQFLVCPYLLEDPRFGPKWAFGVPAVVMALATFVFWLGRKKFVHIPASGAQFVRECFSRDAVLSLVRLAVLYVFVAMFWALFDQMDSAWVLQAEKMNRTVLHWETAGGEVIKWTLLSSQIAAVNPLMILILIPVFSLGIYPAINKVFPLTALRKISIGLFVASGAFIVSGWVETRIAAGEQPSVAWLILAHAIIAAAEVMVSITCLEFSYTQAPKKMKSFIMAVFLLSVSLGNFFTAVVNTVIRNADGTSKLSGAGYFWFFSGMMIATAIVFIPVAIGYKVRNYIQDEGA